MADSILADQPVRPRRPSQIVRRALTLGLLGVLFLSIVGQVVRDRTLFFAWLSYLPLLPLGLWAVLQDLYLAGRSLPKPRFALAGMGVFVTLISVALMLGTGVDRTEEPDRLRIGLLQWNVHWGGGKHRTEATWESLRADIHRRSPDILVLSDGPSDDWMKLLLGELGDGWSMVDCEHLGGSYWYRLVVCSHWPLEMEYERPISNGHIMAVRLMVVGQPFRLLAVDGESNVVRVPRLPMLQEILELCRQSEQEGRRFDLLAGDFNAPGRSVGFDAYPDVGGYRLTSKSATGWLGTWPSGCPLYDLDHIWVHRSFPIQGAEVFTNLNTDHRGQMVHFFLPER